MTHLRSSHVVFRVAFGPMDAVFLRFSPFFVTITHLKILFFGRDFEK